MVLKFPKWLLVAAALSLVAALPAASATVTHIVDSDGKLTGAKGVAVGSKVYDVEFLDGSCVSLFSNCAADPAASPLPAFAFTTQSDVRAAAIALLAQVFIDIPDGLSFDSKPYLIRGCTGFNSCGVAIPYLFLSSTIRLDAANSDVDESNDLPFRFEESVSFDSSANTGITFARFTEVAPIPLPAGLPLLLAGLGGLAVIRKRKSGRTQV